MGNKGRRFWQVVASVALVVLVLLMLYNYLNNTDTKISEYKYSDIIAFFDDDKVDNFTFDLGKGVLSMDVLAESDDAEDENDNKTSGGTSKDDKNNTSGNQSETTGSDNAESNEDSVPKESAKDITTILGGFINIEDDKPKKLKHIEYTVPSINVFVNDVNEQVRKFNQKHPDDPIEYDFVPVQEQGWLATFLPSLIMFVLLALLMYFMLRQTMGAGSGKMNMFSKARVKSQPDGQKTTFSDVAGAEEEKGELEEIVAFLKSPKKYNELGARIPKGVLLVGPPGTGKTLLARAVAGEANVPFFSISGSDFVEMFVGVGASRVRDLFEQAKKEKPSIVFIDEIDAVGRARSAGPSSGGTDEREQTLNQLLVEMDGFGVNSGVIVIAATNRSDILDKALLRAGRFDRQIMVHYPDAKGREDILKVHTRNKPLAPDVDLSVIAKTTVGFTGADLENVANEGALLAAREGKKAITMKEIEDAILKVVMGTEKRSKMVSEKDKELTAYHEAGHAVATYFCPTQDPVHEVSIIPRGSAGGYTMQLPEADKSYSRKNEMYEDIVVFYGGRVAEQIIIGDISTGASSDIAQATKIARDMVTKYGFSDSLGTVFYNTEQEYYGQAKEYSEEIAAKIDKEIKSITDSAYKRCTEILNQNVDKLHTLAKYLLENEKISGKKFLELMDSSNEVFPNPAE